MRFSDKFFIVLLLLGQDFASAAELQGKGLQTPLTIALSDFKARYVVFRVSQAHADYKITLNCNGKIPDTKIQDFPSYFGLDEITVVDKRDCKNATVSVSAFEFIDQHSPFTIRINEFETFESKLEPYKAIQKAAHLFAKTRSSLVSSYNETIYKEVISILASISTTDIDLQQHIDLTKIFTHFSNKDYTTAKTLLEAFIEKYKYTNSKYLALAYFEYGPFLANRNEKVRLYEKGLIIGKEINDFRIQAKGANFKAVSLVENGHFEDAFSLIQNAYDLYSENDSWRDLFDPLHNMAWANQRAGNFPQAIKFATQQKLLAEKFQYNRGQVSALYNLSLVYMQLGEIHKFDLHAERALKLLEKLPLSQRLHEGYFLLERVRLNLKFNFFNKAAIFNDQLKAYFGEMGWKSKILEAELFEAEILFKRGQLRDAHQTIVSVREKSEDSNDRRTLIKASLVEADIALARNNLVLANQRVTAALEVAEKTNADVRMAKALSKSIKILHRSNAEIETLAEVIKKATPIINKYGLMEDRIELSFHSAKVAVSKNQNQEAYKYLDHTIRTLNLELDRIVRRDRRQNYFQLYKEVYEFYIHLLTSESDRNIKKALELADRYKARTLLEQIYLNENSSTNPASEKKHLQDLLSQAARQAAEFTSKTNTQVAVNESYRIASEISQLEAKNITRNSARIEEMRILTKKGLENLIDQVSLSDGQGMVSYFLGKHQSWAWLLIQGEIRVFDLPGEEVIAEQVEDVLKEISSSPTSPQRNRGHWYQTQTIQLLSETLLEELSQGLTKNDITDLIISADGVLHRLPFDLLNLNDKRLLDTISIAYSPSLKNASFSKKARQARTKTYKNALALSNPNFENEQNKHFISLSFSESESKPLTEYFGDNSKLLKQKSANKKELLKALNTQYSIVHISTHALLNDQQPEFSSLLLAGEKYEDMFLTAPEIKASKFNSDLIVLSACETAAGQQRVGEGLLSLSRSFIEAGAKNVISSHWRVQDEATSFLFERFYHYLLHKNLPIQSSLRRAKLDVFNSRKRDWSDPYYWAGFRLQSAKQL